LLAGVNGTSSLTLKMFTPAYDRISYGFEDVDVVEVILLKLMMMMMMMVVWESFIVKKSSSQ
jgi:hypothetical protein